LARGIHVDPPGEVHARVDAQLAGELLQGVAAFAVADQQQTHVFDVGKRAKQHVEALEEAEPANGEDADFSWRPTWDSRAEG